MPLFYDFYYFYAAGVILLNGGTIYDNHSMQEMLLALGRDPATQLVGFPYPPWTIFLYLPFSFFSFDVACGLWLLFNVTILAASCRLLSRWIKSQGVFRLSAVDLLITAILFYPCFKNLYVGQTTLVSLLGLALYLNEYERSNSFKKGLGLSLILVKPHLLALFVLVSFNQAKKNVRLFGGGFFTGFAVMNLVSLLWAPQLYLDFYHHGFEFVRGSKALAQPTLPSLIAMLYPSGPSRLSLSLLSTILVLFALHLHRFEELRGSLLTLVLSLVLSLLLAPYGWSHDFVLLLPVVLLGANKWRGRFSSRALFLLLTAQFYLLLTTLILPAVEWMTVVIPLSCLLWWYHWKEETSKTMSP